MKLNKKFVAVVMTVAVALAMTPAIAFTNSASATDSNTVATIGSAEYTSLQSAVNAVTSSELTTINLMKSIEGPGFKVPGNKKIIFNLHGNKYTINQGVGSSHSQTNGIQLLATDKTADSNITFLNGTIESSQEPLVAGYDGEFVKGTLFILIQNYSNLTLDNVTMDGVNARTNAYLVSNNSGNTSFKNTTFNTTYNTQHAFDSDHNGSYTSPVVTVNDGCIINGNIQTSHEGTDNDGTNGKIVINGGSFTPTTAGSAQCVLSNIAAGKSAEVTLGAAMTGELSVQKNTTATLDLNGHTITGTSNKTAEPYPYDRNPVIKNAGNLTVSGSGNMHAKRTYDSAVYNTNSGTAVLNGGTYEADGWYALRNEGTMTVNSGATVNSVAGHNTSAIINGVTSHGGNSTETAHMTINGGMFTGYYNVVKNGDTYADLTVNGGTFTVPANSTCTSQNVIKNYGTCTATINGGTFENKTASGIDHLLAKKNTADQNYVVKGGTFSADPSAYVASGYVVSQSGSSYIVSPYVAPKTDTTTTTGSDGTVESTTTTTPDVTTSENGDVAATVDNTEGDKIVKNVKEAEAAAAKDGKTIDTNVVVSGSGSQDAGQVSVSLPASTISGLANETNATVTLKTSIGNVTLDQKALDAVAAKSGNTGTVTLIIVNVDKDTLSASLQKSLGGNVKVIDLKLGTSSGNVTDFNGGTATVETSVPDGIAASDAACVYLDDNNIAYNVSGKVVTVNGKNMYRFTTGHNSHYAIVSKASASSLTKGYAPTGVKAKVTGNKSIKVTWKKFSGATSYRVYKATKKSGKYTYVGKTTGTSLTAKGLKAKTKYYFKVKAMSGVNYKTSKIVSAKTPSANGFLSFTLTNVSGDKVKVHWKAVKGAAKYQIAYDSPGNKTLKTRWTGTNSKNTYTSINRVKGQTYKYKMRYYKIKNGKKVYSDWTEVQSITVGYAPTGVKAKVTGNKSIKVTWKKFSGATSYRVYKATKKTGKYTYVGKTTGTSLTAKGLKTKTKYYFKVKAMSGENYKTSKIVSAKTPSANGFLSFTLTNVSGDKVKVHWKAVKGAAKYQIAYDSPGNKTLKTRWTGTNSKNTYTSINRVKGQTYKYKMRYYKIKNGKKVYSDWTEVQSITVK